MLPVDNFLNPIFAVIQDSPYIIYVKDSEENFVYINTEASKLLGKSASKLEEIKTDNFVEGSKEKEAFLNIFENDHEVLGRESDACSSRVYFLDLKEHPGTISNPLNFSKCFFFVKCRLVGSQDGKVYMLGLGIEITNFLVEHTTLGFFKTILNSMRDSVVLTDIYPPYRIRYVNSAFETLTGFAPDEAIGKAPTEVLKKLDVEDFYRDTFNEKLRRHEACDVVLTNYRKDGTEYRSHISVIPLFHTNAESPDYFLGIQRNVTESIEQKFSLEKKTQKLEALFNGTTNYIWLLNNQGEIEQMNQAACVSGLCENSRVWGTEFEFVKGRWWKANKETRDLIKDFVEKIYETGKVQAVRTSLLLGDNSVIRLKLTATPHRSETGDINYVVVEGTDISELEKEKEKAEIIARGLVADVDQSSDPQYYVQQWQDSSLDGPELERIVKAETTLYSDVKPKVEELHKLIKDPEEGVIVTLNEVRKGVSGIAERMDKSESFFSTLDFFGKTASFVKRPVVKWFLVFVLGAGAFNFIDSAGTRLIDALRIVVEEFEN
jgi:PAS domain S-box-containing protein